MSKSSALNGSGASLSERFLGDGYGNVKTVADNMDSVNFLATELTTNYVNPLTLTNKVNQNYRYLDLAYYWNGSAYVLATDLSQVVEDIGNAFIINDAWYIKNSSGNYVIANESQLAAMQATIDSINASTGQTATQVDAAITAANTAQDAVSETREDTKIAVAISSEASSRSTEIDAAIAQEVTDRDNAIAAAGIGGSSGDVTTAQLNAAISGEVTDRDNAIAASETAQRSLTDNDIANANTAQDAVRDSSRALAIQSVRDDFQQDVETFLKHTATPFIDNDPSVQDNWYLKDDELRRALTSTVGVVWPSTTAADANFSQAYTVGDIYDLFLITAEEGNDYIEADSFIDFTLHNPGDGTTTGEMYKNNGEWRRALVTNSVTPVWPSTDAADVNWSTSYRFGDVITLLETLGKSGYEILGNVSVFTGDPAEQYSKGFWYKNGQEWRKALVSQLVGTTWPTVPGASGIWSAAYDMNDVFNAAEASPVNQFDYGTNDWSTNAGIGQYFANLMLGSGAADTVIGSATETVFDETSADTEVVTESTFDFATNTTITKTYLKTGIRVDAATPTLVSAFVTGSIAKITWKERSNVNAPVELIAPVTVTSTAGGNFQLEAIFNHVSAYGTQMTVKMTGDTDQALVGGQPTPSQLFFEVQSIDNDYTGFSGAFQNLRVIKFP